MTRALALVLLARVASAAVFQEVLPSYTTTAASHAPVANTLYCAAVPAYHSLTGTKFAGDITTGDAGSTSGFGIYPDTNGGTAYATVSGSSAVANTLISGTGFTIPLVAGTSYRICACTTSTLVRFSSVRTLVPAGYASQNDLMNVVTVSIGTAANACTAGVPPSTTGALTAVSTVAIPVVLVEE